MTKEIMENVMEPIKSVSKKCTYFLNHIDEISENKYPFQTKEGKELFNEIIDISSNTLTNMKLVKEYAESEIEVENKEELNVEHINSLFILYLGIFSLFDTSSKDE